MPITQDPSLLPAMSTTRPHGTVIVISKVLDPSAPSVIPKWKVSQSTKNKTGLATSRTPLHQANGMFHRLPLDANNTGAPDLCDTPQIRPHNARYMSIPRASNTARSRSQPCGSTSARSRNGRTRSPDREGETLFQMPEGSIVYLFVGLV